MKRIIYLATFTLALVMGAVSTQAQTPKQFQDLPVRQGEDGGPITPPDPPITDPTKPYRIVEQMPGFKGDLTGYLTKNLKYPEGQAIPEGKARTILQFVVTEKGLVKDIEVVRSSGYPKCDQEALRVLEPMKKKVFWTPGKHGGRNVAVFYLIPVSFNFNK